MRRRHLLAAAALAAVPQSGRAQAFPERPIRFIVPYAPGGSTDTSARIVSEKLAALLGQPVIVENKPGGGTIIGTEIVAKSKPDGHTILLTPAAMIAIAAFGMAVPYDIDKDLVPVVGFVDLPILLAASNKAPFQTVAELITWSKAEPGRTVAYASAGVGSLTHLWGEYVKAKTGLPMEHVGYKGSAEALRDVIAGHVPLVRRRAGADGGGRARRADPRPGGGDGAALGAAARRADRRRGGPARHGRHRAVRHLGARRHAGLGGDEAQHRVQRGARRSADTAQASRAGLRSRSAARRRPMSRCWPTRSPSGAR